MQKITHIYFKYEVGSVVTKIYTLYPGLCQSICISHSLIPRTSDMFVLCALMSVQHTDSYGKAPEDLYLCALRRDPRRELWPQYVDNCCFKHMERLRSKREQRCLVCNH